MRILVCGDRHWKDQGFVDQVLGEMDRPLTIIEGGAPGADSCARIWARNSNVPVDTYRADWKWLGRKAGPLRNHRMLVEGKPDLVLAFHDDIDNSKGTRDMVQRARHAGVPVRVLGHKSDS